MNQTVAWFNRFGACGHWISESRPDSPPRTKRTGDSPSVYLIDERIRPSGSTYLNHLLIRFESISSSWIEGNRLSPKKLAIAERMKYGDRVALDVIASVRATENAIDEIADPFRPISAKDIEDLQNLIEPRLALGLREAQNWVGGPGNSPLRAEFVPPPPAEVPRLVANLAAFISATEGNPVIRAAIAHARFETIHPFVDGNGRTGRALVASPPTRTPLSAA